MEPNNFEHIAKKSLEKRTLQPTTAAWGRIASKLDNAQGAKKKNNRTWMAIAASFIGGLLIAALYFNTYSPMQVINEVVQNNEVDNQNIIETNEQLPIHKIKEPLTPSPLKSIAQSASESKKIVPKDKTIQKKSTSKPNYAAQKSKRRNSFVNKPEKSALAMQKKVEINEIAAPKIKNSSKEKIAATSGVTDASIDALLKAAQRDLSITSPKTQFTDATSLLLDTEAELGTKSFRDKIYKKVISGFSTAKEALVNRNN